MKRLKQWFRGLSTTGKITSIAVASILSFGTIGALAQPSAPASVNMPAVPVEQAKPTPKVETKTIPSTESIPYTSSTIEDGNLDAGLTETRVSGANGIRTVVHEVTLTDGVETSRKEISNTVTRAAVSELIAKGTKQRQVYIAPESNCDSNYSGCVPIASDVDCGGGSGNGPEYVYETVEVIGSDIYDLDRDGNGIGCE